MNQTKLLEIVAEAMEVALVDISITTSAENLEEWDSLGHITLLSALDEATGGKSADLIDLTQASSVAEVAKILEENGL